MTRERADYDVVIVGGGPAGLAAAIRAARRAHDAGASISICLVEKGAAIGAHLLSGAILDPTPLDALLPGWRQDGALFDPIAQEIFCVLTRSHCVTLPQWLLPPMMRHHGDIVVSLGRLARALAQEAERLGVEIYPGFAASKALFDTNGALAGIVTGDFGIARDGTPKPSFTPGMELRGKYVLLAEGARGSLSEAVIARYGLARNRAPQKYALGLKELWRLAPDCHRRGRVLHGLGWPLGIKTGGGLFAYHWGADLCSLGLTVHLDYRDPTLSPFQEFQRAKQHPALRAMLRGGTRIGFGARAITTGGLPSLPTLTFPGGALIGDGAGFFNLPQIQGLHGALHSGQMAGDAAAAAVLAGRSGDCLSAYAEEFAASALHRALAMAANTKPLWSRFATVPGLMLAGLDIWSRSLFAISPIPRLGHYRSDRQSLRHAGHAKARPYPKPDGVFSFDQASSLQLAHLHHDEDQPLHLRLADPDLPLTRARGEYGAPETCYCPAGVYDIVETAGGPRFQINAANCLHCKACDIKDPYDNIRWEPPEGGSGPAYADM